MKQNDILRLKAKKASRRKYAFQPQRAQNGRINAGLLEARGI